MANKGLTDIRVTKTWRDGRAYFETYVDALRNAIGNVSSITNLNLVQLAKDISPSYSYTNNGTASLSKSLQEQINDIQAGGVPITGTTSNSFTIRSASSYLKLNAATLTTPVVLTAPNESGEIVLDTAVQTLINKTLDDPAFINFPHWTRPELIGSGLAIATVGNPVISAMTPSRVAFIDDTNDQLRAYDFSGSAWTLTGAGLAVATVGTPALAAMSSTRIAFLDASSDSLRAYDFNGAAWSLTGAGLSLSPSNVPALVALNSTDVALIETTSAELRVYRFNGSIWAQVGSGLSIPSITGPKLTALNETDVLLNNNANSTVKAYRWDGSVFAQIGTASISTAGDRSPLAALNSTDFAYWQTSVLRIYRFNEDEDTFSQIGSDLAVSGNGTTTNISAMNGQDIAYIDGTNDELRCYRFNFSIGKPYSTAGGSF